VQAETKTVNARQNARALGKAVVDVGPAKMNVLTFSEAGGKGGGEVNGNYPSLALNDLSDALIKNNYLRHIKGRLCWFKRFSFKMMDGSVAF